MSKTVEKGEFTGQYKMALIDIHETLRSIHATRSWTTAEMCVLEVVEDALDHIDYKIVNAEDRHPLINNKIPKTFDVEEPTMIDVGDVIETVHGRAIAMKADDGSDPNNAIPVKPIEEQ